MAVAGARLNSPSGVLICEQCHQSVPITQVQFHVDDAPRAMAWDHRAASESACSRVSAMRNSEAAPIDVSARFAHRLNLRRTIRTLSVVDTGESVAYYVADVHALLWVSANIVAPAGLEPRVTLSHANPVLSTVLSSVPFGVAHNEGPRPEFQYLRVGVGDWLIVSRHNEGTVRKVPGDEFRDLLRRAGVGDKQFREARHELEFS